jgi:hypothetical protein
MYDARERPVPPHALTVVNEGALRRLLPAASAFVVAALSAMRRLPADAAHTAAVGVHGTSAFRRQPRLPPDVGEVAERAGGRGARARRVL